MQSFCPKYEEQDSTATISEDSPPSYTEAMRSNHHEHSQSIWTTPIQPKVSETGALPTRNLLDLDIGAFLPYENPGSPGLPSDTRLGFKPDEKLPRNSSSSSLRRSSNVDQNTRTKRVYRNWNPPMLGNLPDDFLRLIPPDTPTWGAGGSGTASASFSELPNISPASVSDLLATNSKARVHKSRSKSQKVSRSFSETPSDLNLKGRDSRTKSEKKTKSFRAVDRVSKSVSLADDSLSPNSSDKVSRSHSSRHRNSNAHSKDFTDSQSPTHRSVVCFDFNIIFKHLLVIQVPLQNRQIM